MVAFGWKEGRACVGATKLSGIASENLASVEGGKKCRGERRRKPGHFFRKKSTEIRREASRKNEPNSPLK